MQIKVTYGTVNNQLRGDHFIQVHSLLLNYTGTADIENNEARIQMTFYEQLTDLNMEDVVYTLASETITVNVPILQFVPDLPDDPETDVDGAQVNMTIYHKQEATMEPIKEDLAIFDEERGTLTFGSSNFEYLGLSKVIIQYQMQDYLEGQDFWTGFNLQIFPQLLDLTAFTVTALPQFNLERYSLENSVKYGESLTIDLPDSWHPEEKQVFYYKVERGSSSTFVEYDKEEQQLILL